MIRFLNYLFIFSILISCDNSNIDSFAPSTNNLIKGIWKFEKNATSILEYGFYHPITNAEILINRDSMLKANNISFVNDDILYVEYSEDTLTYFNIYELNISENMLKYKYFYKINGNRITTKPISGNNNNYYYITTLTQNDMFTTRGETLLLNPYPFMENEDTLYFLKSYSISHWTKTNLSESDIDSIAINL